MSVTFSDTYAQLEDNTKTSETRNDDIVSRYARFLSGRGKYVMVALWLLIGVFGAIFAPKFLASTTMTFTAPASTLAAKARVQMSTRFPESAVDQMVVVMAYNPNGSINNTEV
jgi:hypothetical protein